MAIQKKQLGVGIVLAIAFWSVLAIMFMPYFGGKNAFDASDQLFNSISKGSTHKMFRGVGQRIKKYDGKIEKLELKLKEESIRKDAEKILTLYGFNVEVSGEVLKINGDYGKILAAVLKDSDDMFYNKGDVVKKRLGMDERQGLYAWWKIIGAAESAFNEKGGKENFASAKIAHDMNTKVVEVGYNFYKIEPESVGSKAGILIFALVFYVIYTLWWGFAIYFMAEGMGLQLSGGKKKQA